MQLRKKYKPRDTYHTEATCAYFPSVISEHSQVVWGFRASSFSSLKRKYLTHSAGVRLKTHGIHGQIFDWKTEAVSTAMCPSEQILRSHLLCGWNTLQGSSSFLPNESFTALRKLASSPILISAHIKLPHFNDLLPYTAHISLLFLMERGCSQKFWRSEFSIACSCCFEILMTDK